MQSLGREPTNDETAWAMGLEESEISMIRSASEPPVSLEILTEEQQPSTFLDEFMEDDPGLRGFDEPIPNPVLTTLRTTSRWHQITQPSSGCSRRR